MEDLNISQHALTHKRTHPHSTACYLHTNARTHIAQPVTYTQMHAPT